VIDVGANLGWYSLLASRLVGPSGRVVAIEASKRTFSLLNRNIRLNNCDNIRTLNVAVWNRRENLRLFYGEAGNSGETTVFPELAGSITPDELVPAAPLWELLTSKEIRTAALVKIDVEGAEAQVIEGLVPLLPQFAADVRFVIEVKPGATSAVRPLDLFRPFTAAGFHTYRLSNAYTSDYYADCRHGKPASPQPIDISRLDSNADLLLTRDVL
jgi:FkbM family methyltransferase